MFSSSTGLNAFLNGSFNDRLQPAPLRHVDIIRGRGKIKRRLHERGGSFRVIFSDTRGFSLAIWFVASPDVRKATSQTLP